MELEEETLEKVYKSFNMDDAIDFSLTKLETKGIIGNKKRKIIEKQLKEGELYLLEFFKIAQDVIENHSFESKAEAIKLIQDKWSFKVLEETEKEVKALVQEGVLGNAGT